jgi:hypothetical protein
MAELSEDDQQYIDQISERFDELSTDMSVKIIKNIIQVLLKKGVNISDIIDIPDKQSSIQRCSATTKAGAQCKNSAKESGHCHVHSKAKSNTDKDKDKDKGIKCCDAIVKATGVQCTHPAKHGTKCGVHVQKQIVSVESAVVTAK